MLVTAGMPVLALALSLIAADGTALASAAAATPVQQPDPAQGNGSTSQNLAGTTSSTPEARSPHAADTSSLRRRGAALRRAVEQEYELRSSQHRIYATGQGRNSFTEVVRRFLPVGMPFGDAVQTLEAAGFAVGPMAPFIGGGYGVAGDIDQLVPLVIGKVSVGIYLYVDPDQGSHRLKNIKASFGVAMP
jgi:hypothetical protein